MCFNAREAAAARTNGDCDDELNTGGKKKNGRRVAWADVLVRVQGDNGGSVVMKAVTDGLNEAVEECIQVGNPASETLDVIQHEATEPGDRGHGRKETNRTTVNTGISSQASNAERVAGLHAQTVSSSGG